MFKTGGKHDVAHLFKGRYGSLNAGAALQDRVLVLATLRLDVERTT